jgi:catechol 2,3-dioxygenase-like lactoylglutathione lyase family enzyme
MAKLNHTIVHSRDPREAADFFVSLFGLPPPVPFGHFLGVQVDNEVTLDFMGAGKMEVQCQHYAFLVTDEEFDQIFGRIRERGIEHYADPMMRVKNEINHHFGGRGVYFKDPSGHLLEIITKPYGKWDEIG